MAWGLPPKYKATKVLSEYGHEEIIQLTNDCLINLGYTVTNQSSYNLTAHKKLSMSVLSFVSFCRPRLDVHVLADEDSKLTVEIIYNYTSGYASSFTDMGKSKRHVDEIMKKIAPN